MAAKEVSASSIDAQMKALEKFLGKNKRLFKGFEANSAGQIFFQIKSQKEIQQLLTPLENALYAGSAGRIEFFNQVIIRVLEECAGSDELCVAYLQFKGKLRTTSVLLAKLLAHILSTPELLTQLLRFLPEKAAEALKILSLEKNGCETSDLEKKLEVKIATKPSGYGGKVSVAYPFALFSFQRTGYRYDFRDYGLRMSLPIEVRACLRRYFLAGEKDPLTPLETSPTGAFRYNSEAYITKNAPVLWSFMSMGQLQYSSTNEKPLKASLRAMGQMCGLPEFFPPKTKDLDTVAAQLLVSFLENCTNQDTAQTPLEYSQYWFKQFDKAKFPEREGVLWMLKEERGIRLLNRIDEGLIELLRGLPKQGFVGAEGLRSYVLLHSEKFMLVPEQYAHNCFFLNPTPAFANDNPYKNLMPIPDDHYFDVVVMTAVRGMMFFFAALGMVEIVYDEPVNKLMQNGMKDYVSPFDNLVAVQITPLGRYLVGAEKKYKAAEASNQESFEVFFDEQMLLAAIHNNDKLRLMAIEKFMRPLALGAASSAGKKEVSASSTNTDATSDAPTHNEAHTHRRYFKMSYEAFLHDCSVLSQVEEKITLFRSQLCSPKQKLPAVWEEFFQNIIARAQPLKKANMLVAYTVQPSPELTRLLSTDVILKRIVIRAEGYRILVAKSDVYALVTRLRQLGYLMNDKESY